MYIMGDDTTPPAATVQTLICTKQGTGAVARGHGTYKHGTCVQKREGFNILNPLGGMLSNVVNLSVFVCCFLGGEGL